MTSRILFYCAITLLLGLQETRSAKILFSTVFASKSVQNFQEPLMLELADRGHQVTLLSQFAPAKKSVRHVLGPDWFAHGSMQNFSGDAYANKGDVGPLERFVATAKHMIKLGTSQLQFCDTFYSDANVKSIMEEKFDLVISAYTFNECGFGLIHRLGAPFILMHANVPLPMNNPTGMPYPLSHLPLPFMGSTDNMSFLERTLNFAMAQFMVWTDKFWRLPSLEKVYQKHVPEAPSALEVASEVSLIMSNSYFTLNFPRPLMPDVIEVAGMHCKPAKKLFKDLEDFVESSGDDGFILFSMGSVLKGSQMPEEVRKSLLNTFGKIKQRVLWKWETETMPDLPPNVKLSKWLPQQDLLGHPKCRAFISHGGLHSLEEAIYHGVPLIGIPMFGDQPSNMKLAKHFNVAVALEFEDLKGDKLGETIRTVLRDPKYRQAAAHMSAIFRDRPEKPLDKAVFHVEYILRHNGALHLRSPARKLNVLQYYSIDVMGLLAFLLVSVLYTIYFFTSLFFSVIVGSVFSGSKSVKPKSGKKHKKH